MKLKIIRRPILCLCPECGGNGYRFQHGKKITCPTCQGKKEVIKTINEIVGEDQSTEFP